MDYREIFTKEDIQEAKENGISYENFYNRVMSLEWTIERAKTQPVKKATQRHGEYSKRAISNGISNSLYYHRVNQKGWSRERACTEPPLTKEQIAEHKRKLQIGKSKYGQYLKIALSNNISKTAFYQRITKGEMSLEDACTIPVMNKRECARFTIRKKFKHKYGRDYDECMKIAGENKISPSAVYQRLNQGWTLERAITVPRRRRKGNTYVLSN